MKRGKFESETSVGWSEDSEVVPLFDETKHE